LRWKLASEYQQRTRSGSSRFSGAARSVKSPRAWLDHDKSGGPLGDLHIHDVDFALFLLGVPDSLIASGRASKADSGLDMVHTLYRYDRGPQVHLHAGWSTAPIPFHAGYEAWFENGFVRHVCGEESLLEVYEKGREEPVPAKAPATDAYAEELSYFIGTILTDSTPDLCPPESSRKALALSLAGLEAARTGRMLSSDEIL
jgi:predicted dehydrogenase